MRINRAIALTGYCSRRMADELIAAGRVEVNGKVVKDFNALIDPDKHALSVDGQTLSAQKKEYVALHKPKDVIVTCNDDLGRKTVIDLLPEPLKHLKPVGRLDRDSEGLLILTNDGELAWALTHPAKEVPKHYVVTVSGKISKSALAQLRGGVSLSKRLTARAEVILLDCHEDESRLAIAIHEGRNRQLRRMCAKLGYPVKRLVRAGIGELQLNGLKLGCWRHLTAKEVNSLKSGL